MAMYFDGFFERTFRDWLGRRTVSLLPNLTSPRRLFSAIPCFQIMNLLDLQQLLRADDFRRQQL